MQSVRRGAPGCKIGVKILTQQRPQASPNVAQLIVSSEFTVIRPDRVSQHLLSSCCFGANVKKVSPWTRC